MGYNKLAGQPILATEFNSFLAGAGLYGESAVGTDAYAITVVPAPNDYDAGDRYTFKADVANTGTATLNVNGLGAKTIKKDGGIDLATNDIIAGQIITVVYDGTYFQILSFQSGWSLIKKTATESRSSTTYADDSNLVFNYLANSSYTIKIKAFFVAGSTSGIKFRLNSTQAISYLQSGWFMRYRQNSNESNFLTFHLTGTTVNNHLLTYQPGTNIGAEGILEIEIALTTDANAGVLSLQWAQDSVANASSVRIGSTLEYAKL